MTTHRHLHANTNDALCFPRDSAATGREIGPCFHEGAAGPEKHLWTDGSFSDREGTAGWSVVDPTTAINLCGSVPASELVDGAFNCDLPGCVGVLEALRYHSDCVIVLHVDNQSTVDVGMRLSSLTEADLDEVPCARVWKLTAQVSIGRVVKYVRAMAHSGDEYNEQADILSKFGSRLPAGEARRISCPHEFGVALASLKTDDAIGQITRWDQWQPYRALTPLRHSPPTP